MTDKIAKLQADPVYEHKKAAAIAQMQQLIASVKNAGNHQNISLKAKSTTHFFRTRKKQKKLNLLAFNQVIQVDVGRKEATVEGLVKFYDLANATLPYGLIPEVTPELRAITVGGAIAGLGVEATSSDYGLFHETVLSFELLTGDGRVINCSPTENPDLFYAVPNALRTLGYVLQARVKLLPIKTYVHATLHRFTNLQEYFQKIDEWCKTTGHPFDFLDGVIFSATDAVLITGEFTDQIPSHHKPFDPFFSPYFQELAKKDITDLYFYTKKYLWRWDYDCFWGTDREFPLVGKILLQPSFRKRFGKAILRSDRLISFNHLMDTIHDSPWAFWTRWQHRERLIQDAGIPIKNCVEFLDWYDKEIQLYPIWICPVVAQHPHGTYPLSSWEGKTVVDIGFYTGKKLPPGAPPNFYNRQVEEKLNSLHAVKGWYSTSFYPEAEFWKLYDEHHYKDVKERYDPHHIFPDLYQKAVGFHTL